MSDSERSSDNDTESDNDRNSFSKMEDFVECHFLHLILGNFVSTCLLVPACSQYDSLIPYCVV